MSDRQNWRVGDSNRIWWMADKQGLEESAWGFVVEKSELERGCEGCIKAKVGGAVDNSHSCDGGEAQAQALKVVDQVEEQESQSV